MILKIECENCGNNIVMNAPMKKYLQMRDVLRTKQFHYDSADIKGGRLKEIRITCDKCNNWITVGLD